MLFHVGSLWRINEAGWLSKLQRISSVSGGSITAGVLGMNWHAWASMPAVSATRFRREVVDPIRRLAERTIDEGSIIGGILLPGTAVADRVIAAYRRHVFGDATLQILA